MRKVVKKKRQESSKTSSGLQFWYRRMLVINQIYLGLILTGLLLSFIFSVYSEDLEVLARLLVYLFTGSVGLVLYAINSIFFTVYLLSAKSQKRQSVIAAMMLAISFFLVYFEIVKPLIFAVLY